MANHFTNSMKIQKNMDSMKRQKYMNSMKRQKDKMLKDEFPRSVGAQYATGDQWRNNSRKNEDTEPK